MENTVVETAPTKTDSTAETATVESITTTNITSIFWGQKTIIATGQFQLNFFFGGSVIVRADSQVAVSITEVTEAGMPFLGSAPMSIMNVVPQSDGTITVRGHVNHTPGLRCLLNFIIVN